MDTTYPAGQRVRILPTDSRGYLHGLVGTIRSGSRPAPLSDIRVDLDGGQRLPNGFTHHGWWVYKKDVEVIEDAKGLTQDADPLADAAADDLQKTYVRTTALLAGITAPGFYTIGADENGRLQVESFTSATVLEKDGPEEPAGVWVSSEVNPNSWDTLVNSIHEDEVEAYRALNHDGTRPRVTFVEFGAPVRQVITETHDIIREARG